MTRNIAFSMAFIAALVFWAPNAEAQGRAARTQPTRDGLYLQGGGWFVGNRGGRPWFRAEVGIHLARLTRADLYLQIPVMITGSHYDGPGYRYGYFGMAIVPGVRGEWTMLNRKGDLAIFLEGGGGILFRSWSSNNSTGPAGHTDTYGLLRTGVGVTYTAPFGLMASVQPFGFGWVLGEDRGAFWDASLMLGYRWP